MTLEQNTDGWIIVDSYQRCGAQPSGETSRCSRVSGEQGLCGNGNPNSESSSKTGCPVALNEIERRLLKTDFVRRKIAVKVSPDGKQVIGEASDGSKVIVNNGAVESEIRTPWLCASRSCR